jgi:hypothetical protein
MEKVKNNFIFKVKEQPHRYFAFFHYCNHTQKLK